MASKRSSENVESSVAESDDMFTKITFSTPFTDLLMPYQPDDFISGGTDIQYEGFLFRDGWVLHPSSLYFEKPDTTTIVVNPVHTVVLIGRLPEFKNSEGPFGMNGGSVKRPGEKSIVKFGKTFDPASWNKILALYEEDRTILFAMSTFSTNAYQMNRLSKQGHGIPGIQAEKLAADATKMRMSRLGISDDEEGFDEVSETCYDHMFVIKLCKGHQWTIFDSMNPSIYKQTDTLHREFTRDWLRKIGEKLKTRIKPLYQTKTLTKEGWTEVELKVHPLDMECEWPRRPRSCAIYVMYVVAVAAMDQRNDFPLEMYDRCWSHLAHDIFLAKWDFYTTGIRKDHLTGEETLKRIGENLFVGTGYEFPYNDVLYVAMKDRSQLHLTGKMLTQDTLNKVNEKLVSLHGNKKKSKKKDF